jgi:phage shock protein C
MAARLERPRGGRMIAGVCAGLARHYGWSVTKVRLVFLLFAFFGAGEIAYLALWLIMPKAGR